MSLTNVTALQVLDLSNNKLTGGVPDNGTFSLFTPISPMGFPRFFSSQQEIRTLIRLLLIQIEQWWHSTNSSRSMHHLSSSRDQSQLQRQRTRARRAVAMTT
ncbi:uncharacterized protein LOC131257916 isoform X2 [Magnolia sinica]|uniref:uncharacterized protein LOC131257916 isoform X2 n=1 Tax=Magnolia sinica TaxID=86752 RepID=UPI00265A10FA|nr:uncharacterized protein LOC131257916 isoform X2 [Magnolia sinica]